jgi:hypothetical protein
MRAAGILRPTMRSRDILHQSKGDQLDQAHSGQMVLKMIRQGGWSGGAIAQRRPRVPKLGLKGPSDYHSNEIAVKAARWRGQRAKLKGYSHRESSQGQSWTTALDLTKLGQKAATANKKELLTLSWGEGEEESC